MLQIFNDMWVNLDMPAQEMWKRCVNCQNACGEWEGAKTSTAEKLANMQKGQWQRQSSKSYRINIKQAKNEIN